MNIYHFPLEQNGFAVGRCREAQSLVLVREAMPSESTQDLEGLCFRLSSDCAFAVMALFLWIEELPLDNPEFVCMSLSVNWRDLSIAHVAEIKAPRGDFRNTSTPCVLLHDTLHGCEFSDTDTAMYSSATLSARESASPNSHARMQSLLQFVNDEDISPPAGSNVGAQGEALKTFGKIVDVLSSKLEPEKENPNDVFHPLRLHLEGSCKRRIVQFLRVKKHAVYKKKLGAETQSLPLCTLLNEVQNGETSVIADHPLKSVSAPLPVIVCHA